MGTRPGFLSRATALIGAFALPPFRGPMAAALVGLAMSFVLDAHLSLPRLCGAMGNFTIETVAGFLQLFAMVNRPETIVLAWSVMLVAMMPPLIAFPLAHVQATALTGNRFRATTAFLAGYFGVWLLAGIPLLGVAAAFRLLYGGEGWALCVAVIVALSWSASPIQQAARNRAHGLRRLRLFGLAADRDRLIFGAVQGWWCVASCCAWMIVPLMVMRGHQLAMIMVTFILITERLRGAATPRWRWPLIVRLTGQSTSGIWWALSRKVRYV